LKEKTGLTKKDVDLFLKALTEVIKEKVRIFDMLPVNPEGKQYFLQVLNDDNVVRIPYLGSFKQRASESRYGRNPQTNETMYISGSRSVAFRAAANMKTKDDGSTQDEEEDE
jgi:nucleoid DNA-binding protein